jgi:hypothetical protein
MTLISAKQAYSITKANKDFLVDLMNQIQAEAVEGKSELYIKYNLSEPAYNKLKDLGYIFEDVSKFSQDIRYIISWKG